MEPGDDGSRCWRWVRLQGKAVGVAGSVALKQPVTLELSQVEAESVQSVSGISDLERGQDGLVDLPRAPRSNAGKHHVASQNNQSCEKCGLADR